MAEDGAPAGARSPAPGSPTSGSPAPGSPVSGAPAPEGSAATPPEEVDDGPDAAGLALNRVRAAARAQGHSPGRASRAGAGTPGGGFGAPGGRRRPGAPEIGTWSRSGRLQGRDTSGAGPDARDPQTVSGSIGRLVHERGWSEPVAIGGVIGRWAQVVGPSLAEHCTPERFEDGVLEVRADSTAWATQVRLLQSTVLRRLGEELGEGVVERLQVRGPVAPTWHRGPRSVSDGRGPRDTYG